MYGSASGGANLAGHVLSATVNPASSTLPVWQDLTLSPVGNDTDSLNKFGMDISSIFIDPHDTTGNTVYMTVEGARSLQEVVRVAYRTTDGGRALDESRRRTSRRHRPAALWWIRRTPTRSTSPRMKGSISQRRWQIARWLHRTAGRSLERIAGGACGCAERLAGDASSRVLVAATYGRGIWQMPLWTAAQA